MLLLIYLFRQSLSASNHFLNENRDLLAHTMSRSQSLRRTSFPSVKVAESILEGRNSGYLEAASTIGSAEFDFDDDVINSTAYRRAMAGVQRDNSMRRKVKHSADNSRESNELQEERTGEMIRDTEDPSSRGTSRVGGRTPAMETLREELEQQTLQDGDYRRPSDQSSSGATTRQQVPTGNTLRRGEVVSPDTVLSNSATIDSNSFKSPDPSLREDASYRSPDTSASDISGGVVNFSRKPPMSEAGTMQSPPSFRTDSMNEFYDDSSSHFAPAEDRETAQAMPASRYAPASARRVDHYSQDANPRRGAMPFKAARRLGVDDRTQPRLAHIEENPPSDAAPRPPSSASTQSGSSRDRAKRKPPPQKTLSDLARRQPLDWSQPWSVFWQLEPEEIRKPPHGYSIGLQELWWKLLQLEEHYQISLELLHNLITSDNMSLPTCGITPLAVKKLQLSHDKFLRQPLRAACGVGPWNFEYPAIVKAYQSAHAHLVPLYERFAWDLPLVTFQVAASSAPASSASRDLLLSIGPGLPTRYTCLRSPLTHVCATFDTIQALYDGMNKGGSNATPNFATIMMPVREQLRSLIASCNRNILLRWDDLRRSNLFGSNASRDISVVTKELIFPPSQRRNMQLLNLSSPTRAVISRADLHWKAKPSDSWSRCHAILLNNYLILASTSDSKGQRQHQIYHLVRIFAHLLIA